METQGASPRPGSRRSTGLILSPKPPSSGMITDWDALDGVSWRGRAGPRLALKIVVFDDTDFAYAKDLSRCYPALPVYLQVGNPAPPDHR